MEWTRHRCPVVLLSTVLRACFNPSWASEKASQPHALQATPDQQLRRRAVQNARSSDGPTSMPSTWRSPSLVTPTATAVV